MIFALTILHFFAFAAGIGAGLANLIVLRAAKSAPADQAAGLRALMPRIGALGAHSLILLWITGPLLLVLVYGGAGLGPWFHVKMLAAVLLTVAVGLSRWTVARLKAGKPAPLAPHMPKLMLAGAILAPLTMVFAVLAFG